MNIDEQFAKLEADIAECKETLEFIKETMIKADTTITKVASEVMPAVQDVMNSPMLKMLGGKRK